MGSINETTMKALETTYCDSCRLITPVWRGRCIHCRANLPAEMNKRKAATTMHASRRT